MGYRSDVVIAVHKTLRAEALLTGNWPVLLKEEPDHVTDDSMFWRIEHIMWYDNYPEIQEMEQFIKDHLEVPPDSPERIAGMRIGEDVDDNETWGCPWEFGIHLERFIDF